MNGIKPHRIIQLVAGLVTDHCSTSTSIPFSFTCHPFLTVSFTSPFSGPPYVTRERISLFRCTTTGPTSSTSLVLTTPSRSFHKSLLYHPHTHTN